MSRSATRLIFAFEFCQQIATRSETAPNLILHISIHNQSSSGTLASSIKPERTCQMSGYDFSPLYRSAQSAVSPGSTFLATAHANRLIIRSSQNLAIVRTWEIQSLGSYDGSAGPSKTSPARTATIDEVQWSGDGLYILAFSRAEQCVWVYALAQEGNGGDGEVVRIKAGPEGLESVGWVKDGREIMCRSDHNVCSHRGQASESPCGSLAVFMVVVSMPVKLTGSTLWSVGRG